MSGSKTALSLPKAPIAASLSEDDDDDCSHSGDDVVDNRTSRSILSAKGRKLHPHSASTLAGKHSVNNNNNDHNNHADNSNSNRRNDSPATSNHRGTSSGAAGSVADSEDFGDSHAPSNAGKKKKKKKSNKKALSNMPSSNTASLSNARIDRQHLLSTGRTTSPHTIPSSSNNHHVSKPSDIWYKSDAEEKLRIREFWLELTEDERRALVKLEKEAVLKKMKEQQKQTCSCSVCGRKRYAYREIQCAFRS